MLDFRAVEIDALELISHYVFFCLEGRQSPIFGRISKTEYRARLKQLTVSGQKIRVGKIRLSALVSEPQVAKLVERLEVLNEP